MTQTVKKYLEKHRANPTFLAVGGVFSLMMMSVHDDVRRDTRVVAPPTAGFDEFDGADGETQQ